MSAMWHEMRQALSQLRHSPGFTVLAVVILGFGLGTTLYMFTVVKAYMQYDPPTFITVALILCVVAIIASLLPALRALRVNPMEALRHE